MKKQHKGGHQHHSQGSGNAIGSGGTGGQARGGGGVSGARVAKVAPVSGSAPRPMQVHYIVAVIWMMLAMAGGYWVGKFGFALPPEYAAPGSGPSAADAAKEEAAIRTFINRYFSTWSAKDLEGYGACFGEDATVAFVDEIAPVVLDKDKFMESQRRAHERATAPMTEAPESVAVQVHGNVAHVQVRWLLKKAEGNERGWDFFTLVKVGGAWQIIHLSFFSDRPPA